MTKCKDGKESMRGFSCAAGGNCSHPSTCRLMGCAAEFSTNAKTAKSSASPACSISSFDKAAGPGQTYIKWTTVTGTQHEGFIKEMDSNVAIVACFDGKERAVEL